MTKTDPGRYFEDFRLGETLHHSVPRTLHAGDVALYTALYGGRFALQSSTELAKAMGLDRAPADDLLVFHLVFGKSVPEISLNAVANLGYAAGRFLAPVYPGDTLSASSEVIGLKENSNAKTGIVYVRTQGHNQHGESVLDYVRWVMVRKADPAAPAPEPVVPELPEAVSPAELAVPAALDFRGWDPVVGGTPYRWENYEIGERIDHVDGQTIEEAEHQMAARLYHNTARVHFNQHVEGQGRFGRRIVYGGHIISLARALSFNGLGAAVKIVAINGGRHTNPSFAGDTVYAWSEVLDKAKIAGREDVGALRLRLVAAKDRPCSDFPLSGSDGKPDPAVVLDFDYWALMARA